MDSESNIARIGYRVTTPSGNRSQWGMTQREAVTLSRSIPGSVIEPEIAPPKGLVLQRSVGQSILIGDSVRVTLAQISGTRANVVIHAPANVRIVREEIA
jgi:hypothetical protein